MESISLNEKTIKGLEPLSDFSEGSCGACYKYGEEVLKVFYYDLDYYVSKNVRRNVERESDIIMYPKKILYVIDGKYPGENGYTCNLAKGRDLIQTLKLIEKDELNITFEELLTIFYDVFLPKLYNEKVFLHDTKPTHMFLSDEIQLIDTDLYESVPFYIPNAMKTRVNLRQVNNSFIYLIEYFFPRRNRLLFDNRKMGKEDFIENCFTYISKLTGGINDLKELSNYKFTDSELLEIRRFVKE